ncbi:hypothetical protein [Mobilicoccus pelagius]|nr:hypothetical protein [Mobilicoccus pelagius]
MDLLRPVIGGTVLILAIYPEKDAPGRSLQKARIETEGLEGDRRKKRAVHLVGRGHQPEVTRANVFLDVADEELQNVVGQEVRLGTALLRVTELPKNCPGVYAEVVRPGVVAAGDRLS